MKKYLLYYLLRNQSELFSDPQVYETDLEGLVKAILVAQENGYKIVDLEIVNDQEMGNRT